MFDTGFVTEVADFIRNSLNNRGAKDNVYSAVDYIVDSTKTHNELITECKELRLERNKICKEIGFMIRDGKDAASKKLDFETLNSKIRELEDKTNEILQNQIYAVQLIFKLH